ncbi:MAG: dihydrofolate reductase [Muribaculaceae bacterium]|nr:dihydrofolate reductase [Muribaculaceae bacterium]
MTTTIIAAVASDRGIGRGGDLAFHISADLKRFKALTTGHTVIMGRKTFESLPKGALPNRRNIVITRDPSLTFPGAETATSVEAAIAIALSAGETDAFIIGGAQIYAQSLPLADRLEITAIDSPAPGADVFFPEIDPAQWQLVDETPTQTDDKSGVAYRFQSYTRLR